ncbi:hypothetical protein, partial [Chitinophaga sp. CF118]|uniref:hypothetical protein n=1 Tax=Chitinophaga sp. CF118 TaxID=1884367 RepID=UPI001C433FDC
QTKAATSKNSLPGKETPTAQKRDCVRLVIWKRYALSMLHLSFKYFLTVCSGRIFDAIGKVGP